MRDAYKAAYGVVDTTDPKTIYVKIGTWMEAMVDATHQSRHISALKNRIRAHTHLAPFPPYLDRDKHLLFFDVKSTGVRFNKRSFVDLEFTFYNRVPTAVPDTLETDLRAICEHLCAGLDADPEFRFHLTKTSPFVTAS